MRFSFLLLLFGSRLASCVDRDPRVLTILDKHAGSISKAVHLITSVIHDDLHVFIPPFEAKQAGSNIPARESTLIDASLSMVHAVRSALQLDFPSKVSRVDVVLQALIPIIADAGELIIGERERRRLVLAETSRLVSDLNLDLRNLVSAFAEPISGHVNFALFEVMVQATGWPHCNLVDTLIFGFHPIGVVPSTGCLRPVCEEAVAVPSKESNLQSFADAVEHLSRKARKANGNVEAKADCVAVWDATMAEVDKGFCVGPLSMGQVQKLFSDSSHGPRCIPAFGVWQKGKLRRIDDAAESGHNELTQMLETIVCAQADLPAELAIEFYKVLPPGVRLRLGTDDIASAYRVLASAEPEYNVAAVWCPGGVDASADPGVQYFALRGFNFGLKSAPVHLATLMRPMMEFARNVMLVACEQFYDDVVVVDPVFGRVSAQRNLDFMFRLLGFPFAPRKHERLREANAFLGVVTDFSSMALGYVLLRIKEKRRRNLISELRDVLRSGKLSPGHAARLRGKLYFSTTSAFGGVGRPALQAFATRQYSKSKNHSLDDSLRGSIQFFIRLLADLPSQRVQLKDSHQRPLYVWSDAMWEATKNDDGSLACAIDGESGDIFYIAEAAIAFVVFDPVDGSWHAGAKKIGADVIKQMVPGKKTYIGQLECLAADAVLYSLPTDRLVGREAIMWIDNLSAKYGLQKAYSKVEDSGRIVNSFKVMQANLRMKVHFEYVPSAQNLADLPSRGDFEKMKRVIEEATGIFPRLAQVQWHDCVVPDFSSWEAPLAGVSKKRRRRSGSRGAARKARRGGNGVVAVGSH